MYLPPVREPPAAHPLRRGERHHRRRRFEEKLGADRRQARLLQKRWPASEDYAGLTCEPRLVKHGRTELPWTSEASATATRERTPRAGLLSAARGRASRLFHRRSARHKNAGVQPPPLRATALLSDR